MINDYIKGSDTDKAKCTGCSACEQVCQSGAIVMSTDCEHFVYPKLDKENCIGCKQCEKVCPMVNIKQNMPAQRIYACYAKDSTVRNSGSSGGLFGVIADAVIDEGGIVYGAAFSDGFVLKHMAVDKKGELDRLCKSKYLQSDMSGVYSKISEQLNSGRYVYFCGTPCQVAALHNYLGRTYDNLLTSDIVCHGVPSNRMFIDAVKYEEERIHGHITDFGFRAKNNPYKTAHVCKYSYFKNDPNKLKTKYKQSLFFPFYNAYSKALTNRHSCYQCPYASTARAGDITLCDFWGIDGFSDHMKTSDGVSGIIVNSSKGDSVFTQIKEKIECEEYDISLALKHNGWLSKPTVKPVLRDELIKAYINEGFSAAAKLYMKPKHAVAFRIYFSLPLCLRKTISKVKKALLHN